MRKSKYQDLLDKGFLAVRGDTQSSGWAIYGYEYGIDDYVIAGYITSRGRENPRRYKVYYSSGHCASPYFRAYGQYMWLDTFIKV